MLTFCVLFFFFFFHSILVVVYLVHSTDFVWLCVMSNTWYFYCFVVVQKIYTESMLLLCFIHIHSSQTNFVFQTLYVLMDTHSFVMHTYMFTSKYTHSHTHIHNVRLHFAKICVIFRRNRLTYSRFWQFNMKHGTCAIHQI